MTTGDTAVCLLDECFHPWVSCMHFEQIRTQTCKQSCAGPPISVFAHANRVEASVAEGLDCKLFELGLFLHGRA